MKTQSFARTLLLGIALSASGPAFAQPTYRNVGSPLTWTTRLDQGIRLRSYVENNAGDFVRLNPNGTFWLSAQHNGIRMVIEFEAAPGMWVPIAEGRGRLSVQDFWQPTDPQAPLAGGSTTGEQGQYNFSADLTGMFTRLRVHAISRDGVLKVLVGELY